MIPIHHRLSEIADRYDAFVIDLWGVLHDGERAFPEAVACLEQLRAHDKRVLILSNAPRRAESVAARNVELGIARELCDGVMSSGEAAWRHLARRDDPWHRALGRRCHHLGPARDRGMREGLDYDFVEDPGQADFILNTGTLDFGDSPARYDPLLRAALARRLPMVCANPDLEVIRGDRREICAGTVARAYEEMGGEVRYHGKPHPGVYEDCLALIAAPARDRIAAIGDSLRTDIAGARAAGIDGIFVTGGLQGEALGADSEGNVAPARLATFCEAAGETPTAALPMLRW
jgi:HAD superfamily hydrolase (TIGR01459 family)